jgi:hypothetical protein
MSILQRTVGVTADSHIPVSTASPAADGPLAGTFAGVGRAVGDRGTARCLSVSPTDRPNQSAPIDSSPGTAERIVIGLNVCFEGEQAHELFGLVLDDLLAVLPERLRGLERVGVTTIARVGGGRDR